MARNATASLGGIIGGIAGLIIGIAVLTFIPTSGESLAVVDPAAPAVAIVVIAASAIVGAIVGWLIFRSRG